LRSGFCEVSGKDFDGLLRERKRDRVAAFSMGKSQFSLTERDIIQSDGADLHGPQAQGIGQEDDGIGSDIVWSGKTKGGEQGLHLLGTQELGRLLFAEQTRSHKQRSEVFLQDPALPVQVRQESPQMRSIDATGRACDLQSCQELIKIFNLQLGQGKTVCFKVVMCTGYLFVRQKRRRIG